MEAAGAKSLTYYGGIDRSKAEIIGRIIQGVEFSDYEVVRGSNGEIEDVVFTNKN